MVAFFVNLKTAVQATEITEDTENVRIPHVFHIHLMGEVAINDNPWFFGYNIT